MGDGDGQDWEAGITVHYHMGDITPITALYEMAGRHFLVNHLYPSNVKRCHEMGQSVMLDNGAYGVWKSGKATNWPKYYAWCDMWLDYPTTWAIPPDVIDAPSQEQDALLNEWPHGKKRAAPVWHMDEPITRICRLIDDGWSRVCIGSTAEFAIVMSQMWERRMDETWNEIARTFGRVPPTHMLRGMACAGKRWPFASLDSSDIAQNHCRPQNTPRKMADRWDAIQCPARWVERELQMELV